MKKILIFVLLVTTSTLAKLHIILFDCSGSFIGPNVPITLKKCALVKIGEIVSVMQGGDSLIFIPIRENSTVSSLNQILFIKPKATAIFDAKLKGSNTQRLKELASSINKEINKPASERTDIIAAVNYAGSIAKTSSQATIYNFSDGDDNVSSKMFMTLKGIRVLHLFVFSKYADKTNVLLRKWEGLYSKLGASSFIVLDAPTSINYKIQ